MAGGNGIMFALGSPMQSMDSGASSPQAGISNSVAIGSSSGSAAPLGHVQIAVGAMLLLSLAALVLLNKAGFRFSVTVG